jgi:hypothetical protein
LVEGQSGQGDAGYRNHRFCFAYRQVFFQRETGTRFQFVPYTRGATQVIQALMASQIDMVIADPIVSLPASVRSSMVLAART